eukprot:g43882.t1
MRWWFIVVVTDQKPLLGILRGQGHAIHSFRVAIGEKTPYQVKSDPPILEWAGLNSIRNANAGYKIPLSRTDSLLQEMKYDAETTETALHGIRIAGIKGIQGVVRKTVNDELQTIIWEPQHMDKIVPSLLFNMQTTEDPD